VKQKKPKIASLSEKASQSEYSKKYIQINAGFVNCTCYSI